MSGSGGSGASGGSGELGRSGEPGDADGPGEPRPRRPRTVGRRAVLAAGVVALAVPLVSLYRPREDLLTAGRRAGHLRLGVSNEPPFGYVTPAGAVTGQSVEVTRRVLADLGVPDVTGVVTDFGGLIPGLLAGSCDVVAAGMTVTVGRCNEVRFSAPLFAVRQGFAVRADDDREIASYDDLLRLPAQVRVAVLSGSVEQLDLQHAGLPESSTVVLPDVAAMTGALLAGRVDVLVLTAPRVRWMASTNPEEVRVAGTFAPDGIVPRCGALAFRPADGDLVAAFDRALARRFADGWVQEMSASFGFAADEIQDARRWTVGELCAGIG
ncbi:ectoine/hydroxyectoine ABC transporter substrate-binding protein EhuB [Actinomycetota bacterium]|nr:ectoine/hydroxyectoine ABC transporter substrate-binding protein EhuB [Actinomycetota bacterium]